MKKVRRTGKRGMFQKAAFLLVFTLMLSMVQPAFAGPAEGGPGPGGESSGESAGGESAGQSGAGAMGDEEVQAVLDEVSASPCITSDVFRDGGERLQFEYQLYSPESVSEGEKYPVVVFLADTMGGANTITFDQYYGAAVWCTAQEQAKHPAYVLVPTLPATAIPDQDAAGFIENVSNLLSFLRKDLPIDGDRMYLVCQGEGCLAGSYIASRHPNLYAAELFNAGNLDPDGLAGLEKQKFFFICSAADDRANESMMAMMDQFSTDGVPYAYGEWNAKDPDQNAKVQELTKECVPANIIRFEPQIMDEDGQMPVTLGHLQSFNYGYKMEAVRDWLFGQVWNIPVQPVEGDYGTVEVQTVICPNCGAEVSGKFCAVCGASLSDAQPAQGSAEQAETDNAQPVQDTAQPEELAGDNSPPQVFSDAETIRIVQELLTALSYYSGGIDGSAGPGTSEGILQFAREHQLPETSDITAELIDALQQAAGQ